jgi:hypothetical protein
VSLPYPQALVKAAASSAWELIRRFRWVECNGGGEDGMEKTKQPQLNFLGLKVTVSLNI